MKITYLARKLDKKEELAEISKEEWQTIIKANAEKNPLEKRYFIVDMIADGTIIDCMLIEVTREKYLEWHREYMAEKRNRNLGKYYKILALDGKQPAEDGIPLKDTLAEPGSLEEMACENIMLQDLRGKLEKWKPWACEYLEAYLSGNSAHINTEISGKYGVTKQTARKYKRQFDSFLEEYLKEYLG